MDISSESNEQLNRPPLPVQEVVDNSGNAVGDAIKEASWYTAASVASSVLWVGSAATSYIARTKYGVEPWVMIPPIVGSVTALEYAGSGLALKNFDQGGKTADINEVDGEKAHKARRIGKELSALAFVAWGGAMPAVKFNNAVGIESTKKRRFTQSALYGAVVSLYSLPFLQDEAVNVGKAAIENPVEALGTTSATALAIYGLIKGGQIMRHRRQQKIKSNNRLATEQAEQVDQ